MATEPYGTFTIQVIQGRCLVSRDSNGFSDPYVKISGRKKQNYKTPVVKKSLDPVWPPNIFLVSVYGADDKVAVQVWDHDQVSADDFMGGFELSVDSVDTHGRITKKWIELTNMGLTNEEDLGEIELKFKFEPRDWKTEMPVLHKCLEPLKHEVPIMDPKTEYDLDHVYGDVFDPNDEIYGVPNVLEDPRGELFWYKRIFEGQPHNNFIFDGTAVNHGIVVLSTLTSAAGAFVGMQTWAILWTQKTCQRFCMHSEAGAPISLSVILGQLNPALAEHHKSFIDVTGDETVQGVLINIENGGDPRRVFKLGVMFAKEGQTVDDEMFGNQHGSAQFDEFLNVLGETVTLKNFEGYNAQLDVQNDNSGTSSVYTRFMDYEVMYHVSTLLQYDPADLQFVQRKRFIGNDIVVIVFVDGKTTYAVNTMKSQYTNILIVVQPDDDPNYYRVQCGHAKGLRDFGPFAAARYPRDKSFLDFLLTKCLNGEMATYVSPEFTVRANRTRKQQLVQLWADLDLKSKDKGKVGAASASSASRVVVPLSNIPLHPPQALSLVPICQGFKHLITCTEWLEDEGILLLGVEGMDGLAGLYIAREGKVGAAPRVPLPSLRHLIAVPELGLVFARTGGESPLVLSFSLAEVLSPYGDVSKTLQTKDVSRMTVGKIVGEAEGEDAKWYLATAEDTTASIFEIKGDTCDRVEDIHIDYSIAALSFTSHGVIIGTSPSEDADACGHFNFFSIPSYSPRLLVTAKTPDAVPMYAHPLPKGGVFLGFSTYGVVVRADGKVDRTMKFEWAARPFKISVFKNFLIIEYQTFTEVRALVSGAVIETHRTFHTPTSSAPDGLTVSLDYTSNPVVCAKDVEGEPTLMSQLADAITDNNIGAVEDALNKGADACGCVDLELNRPLHLAVQVHVEVCKALLRAGADPAARNARGLLPAEAAQCNAEARTLLEAQMEDQEAGNGPMTMSVNRFVIKGTEGSVATFAVEDESTAHGEDQDDDVPNEYQRIDKLRSMLTRGNTFTMYTKKKSKAKQRLVYCILTDRKIYWQDPAKKKAKKSDCVPFNEMTGVGKGLQTALFQSCKVEDYCDSRSFSILSTSRTIDLICSSEEERDVWFEAFHYLCQWQGARR